MKEIISGLNKPIRRVPDFPKKGIIFWDISTLFNNKLAFKKTINTFYKHYKNSKIDHIAGIEARGFVLAGALANKLGTGVIMIRKKGKLPSLTVSESYEKEYGKDTIEMHKDAIKKGDKVLLIDDLIATGDTAIAACKLIEKLKGKVTGIGIIVELTDFEARKRFKKYNIFSLIQTKESEI